MVALRKKTHCSSFSVDPRIQGTEVLLGAEEDGWNSGARPKVNAAGSGILSAFFF